MSIAPSAIRVVWVPRVVGQRDLLRPSPGRLVHGRQRIRRFARLAHGDNEAVRVHQRAPVAELGGVIELGRDARQGLDPRPADHGGVEACAHAHQHDPVDRPDLLIGEREVLEAHRCVAQGYTPAEGVHHGLRLLVDLLQHEVGVRAPGRRHRVEVDAGAVLVDGCPVQPGEADPVADHRGDLAVVEIRDLVGVRDQRRQVARHEHLVRTVADDDPAGVAEPERDDPAGFAAARRHDHVGAPHPPRGLADRVLKRKLLVEIRLHQVRYALRVRFGGEDVAPGEELLPELQVVLDDPVVDDDDAAPAVHVRVCVEVGGASVGRPPGVSHAGGPFGQAVADNSLELGEPARRLVDDGLAARSQNGDARAVVATVLQARQPFQQDGRGGTGARISDDPAHVRLRRRHPDARLRARSCKRPGSSRGAGRLSVSSRAR